MTKITLTRRSAGHYVTADGRYSVVQQFDSSAGRGAMVKRGWRVTDTMTQRSWNDTTLSYARDSIVNHINAAKVA